MGIGNNGCTFYKESISVLIPTFNPDNNLIKLIKELKEKWDSTLFRSELSVVIVDDGSDRKRSRELLDILSADKNIKILKHDRNMGKGIAIKSGLKYLQKKQTKFIVTADSDGQHSPHDIYRILAFAIKKDNLVLGVRDFSKKRVPLKSLFGNRVTSGIFFLVTGKKLTDTQTGLRAFPRSFIQKLLNIAGERYEYELNVLLETSSSKSIDTITIDTIYLDNNKKSFFRPIRDSVLVYSVFVKYCLISLLVSILDFAAIYLGTIFFPTIYSFVIVRFVTAHLYFFLMKTKAFRKKGGLTHQVLKYYALVLLNIILSSTIFFNMYYEAKESFLVAYFLALVLMFFVNFFLQKKIVFR